MQGVDSTADNLFVLDTVLSLAGRNCRTVHMTSLDVSKAFDTVSHLAIIAACERAGLPATFVEYIRAYAVYFVLSQRLLF